MKIILFVSNNPIITINVILGLLIMLLFWDVRNDKNIGLRSKTSQEKRADQLITISTNMMSALLIGILVLPLTPLFNSIFDMNSLQNLTSDSFLNADVKKWFLFIEIYAVAILVTGSIRKTAFEIYDHLESEERYKSKFSPKSKK